MRVTVRVSNETCAVGGGRKPGGGSLCKFQMKFAQWAQWGEGREPGRGPVGGSLCEFQFKLAQWGEGRGPVGGSLCEFQMKLPQRRGTTRTMYNGGGGQGGVQCARTYSIPVVPHKAVAEASKINRKPIGEIGCCESGMAERIH